MILNFVNFSLPEKIHRGEGPFLNHGVLGVNFKARGNLNFDRTCSYILQVIANGIQNTLDEATDPWGVVVERVEV